MHKLDLGLIYEGFINNYNGFVFYSGKEDYNYARETHTIIEYFRILGASLGYIPFCEASGKQKKKADLEWYHIEDRFLHLESENFHRNYPNTVEKLCTSEAKIRVGIVWTKKSHTERDDEEALKIMKATYKSGKDDHHFLWIVRYNKPIMDKASNASYSPIHAWRVSKGKQYKLPDSFIVWPSGSASRQTTIWELPESLL